MRYLITLLCTCVLMSTCHVVLVVGLGRVPIQAEYWLAEVIALKRHLAQNISLPKTVIIGGSSAFFGVSAEALARSTGTPVLNQGLHAGMSLESLLVHARAVIRTGDLVVMALEPKFYTDDRTRTPWMIRNAIAWNPDSGLDGCASDRVAFAFTVAPHLLLEMGMAKLGEWRRDPAVLKRIRARSAAQETAQPLNGPPVKSFSYSPTNVNSHGDIMNTQGTPKRYVGKPADTSLPVALSAHARSTLSTFIKEMNERGARLVFVHSPYMFITPPDPHQVGKSDEEFQHQVVGLGQFIDRRNDLLFPKECFFDTQYHLNHAGRAQRTELLAHSLRAYLAR